MKLLIFISFFSALFAAKTEVPKNVPNMDHLFSEETSAEFLYDKLELDETIGFEAFELAFNGYQTMPQVNKEVLTVVDFSKPSTEERFAVIDLNECKVLFRSYVAHGKNSGDVYATDFSNVVNSFKSSLGFYMTGGTYRGRAGYSMLLNGLEKGFNDKARERAIVLHGSKYTEPSMLARMGKLGRSLGCPAIPNSINKDVIDTIKGGSILFIYAPDENYLTSSRFVAEARDLS